MLVFNFYSVIRALDKIHYMDNLHWHDHIDEGICSFCGKLEDEACESSCLSERIRKFDINFSSVDYDTIANILIEISNGVSYESRNNGFSHTSCAFCNSCSDDHTPTCPSIAIRYALGLFDESDRPIVEMSLYTDEAEKMFHDAVKLLNNIEAEKKRLDAITKEAKATKIREEKKARTCRYCSKILKSVDGRKHHEKTVKSCLEQFLIEHPTSKLHKTI